jgi:hypothetical protein
MVLCLALLAAGPVWIAVTTSVAQTPRGRIPDWVWHASPFTSIYALTGSGLSGPRGPVSPGAWTMLGIVAGLATALWTLAWTNETPDREDQDRVN